MFKKPTSTAPGKENIGAPRPRLGLSSLIQHSSKKKVESDIESAGASLKVLSVENPKQKISPVDLQTQKIKSGVVSHSKPSQPVARTASVTHQSANGGNERPKINDIKTEPKHGASTKMNEGIGHSARSAIKHEASAPKPNNMVSLTKTLSVKFFHLSNESTI